jgi:hypothetical protein
MPRLMLIVSIRTSYMLNIQTFAITQSFRCELIGIGHVTPIIGPLAKAIVPNADILLDIQVRY